MKQLNDLTFNGANKIDKVTSSAGSAIVHTPKFKGCEQASYYFSPRKAGQVTLLDTEHYPTPGILIKHCIYMNNITTGKGTFLFVEVSRLGVFFFESDGYLFYGEPSNVAGEEYKRAGVKLPGLDWKFIAVMASGLLDHHEASQNLTEATAELIVDNNGAGCYDNYRLKKDEKYTCLTALDSFQCLLESSAHQLKEGTNYAILKMQKS